MSSLEHIKEVIRLSPLNDKDRMELIEQLVNNSAKSSSQDYRYDQIVLQNQDMPHKCRVYLYSNYDPSSQIQTKITYRSLNRQGIDIIRSNIPDIEFKDYITIIYPLEFEINAIYLIRYCVSRGYRIAAVHQDYEGLNSHVNKAVAVKMMKKK